MKRLVVNIHGVMTENVLLVSEHRVQVERHLTGLLTPCSGHGIPDRETVWLMHYFCCVVLWGVASISSQKNGSGWI